METLGLFVLTLIRSRAIVFNLDARAGSKNLLCRLHMGRDSDIPSALPDAFQRLLPVGRRVAEQISFWQWIIEGYTKILPLRLLPSRVQ